MTSIFDRFAILKPDLLLDELDFSPSFYEQLDSRYAGFKDHTLIAAHHFTGDWPTWEMHPAGDELVVLMSGQATFILKGQSGDESVELSTPGAYLVVPRNTWHTAHIQEAASLLFVTPGEGTLNEESPPATD